MHSSRMRTACLLPVSPSMHCSQGDVPAGGIPAQGGVPAREGLYLPRYSPPGTEFLTHATENITFPQTSFAGGNKRF